MRIRLVRKTDEKKAAAILAEVFYPSKAEAAAIVRQAIGKKSCLLAEESHGEYMGVLIYARDWSHYANYATDLAVLPRFRHRGVATALLNEFVRRSKAEQPKNQRLVLSSTAEANRASIRLHLKAGFEKIGTLKGLHFGKDEAFFACRI